MIARMSDPSEWARRRRLERGVRLGLVVVFFTGFCALVSAWADVRALKHDLRGERVKLSDMARVLAETRRELGARRTRTVSVSIAEARDADARRRALVRAMAPVPHPLGSTHAGGSHAGR